MARVVSERKGTIEANVKESGFPHLALRKHKHNKHTTSAKKTKAAELRAHRRSSAVNSADKYKVGTVNFPLSKMIW